MRWKPRSRTAIGSSTPRRLATKHRKTPAQIVLRWHIEHGLCAIPKSFRPERIAENINIFDFALTRDDIAAIDALDTGVRGGPDPDVVRPTTGQTASL